MATVPITKRSVHKRNESWRFCPIDDYFFGAHLVNTKVKYYYKLVVQSEM